MTTWRSPPPGLDMVGDRRSESKQKGWVILKITHPFLALTCFNGGYLL